MNKIPWAPTGLFPPLIPSRREAKRMNVVKMELNVYCTECNVLIKKGHSAVKVDGATFHHVTCPTTRMRRFAAHKQPNTGMRFERDE